MKLYDALELAEGAIKEKFQERAQSHLEAHKELVKQHAQVLQQHQHLYSQLGKINDPKIATAGKKGREH